MAMEGAVGYVSGKVVSLATGQLDGLVDQLFGKLISLAKDQVSIVLDLDDEIKFLKKVLPKLNEVILNAEVKSEEMAELRGVLIDFVEDAEDIVDEFDTELAQRRPSAIADRQRNRSVRGLVVWAGVLVGEQRCRTLLKLVCGCLPSSSCFDPSDYESVSLFFYAKIANQIKGLYGGFEQPKSDVGKVRLFVDSAKESLGVKSEQNMEADGLFRRPITDEVRRADVELVGRERDKEEVLKLLLESSSRPSVVLVKGMGGIGKTALAKDIFNTSHFDKHFEIKKWACVGDGLNPEHILENFFDSENPAEVLPKLKGKKFLIVLDDCWIGKMKGWNKLWAALSYGGEGSKVLVTSRQDVSKELEAVFVRIHELGLLSEEECLEIFESYAFPNGAPSSSSGRNSTSRLHEIGIKIVKHKIGGVPLVARLLGSSLRNEFRESAWYSLLNGPSDSNDIISILMWSYRRLPSHLKQCFAYLSFFPKDFTLEKEAIVRMWIAHGYVQPRGNLRLEDIGDTYFDDLVRASLILGPVWLLGWTGLGWAGLGWVNSNL